MCLGKKVTSLKGIYVILNIKADKNVSYLINCHDIMKYAYDLPLALSVLNVLL